MHNDRAGQELAVTAGDYVEVNEAAAANGIQSSRAVRPDLRLTWDRDLMHGTLWGAYRDLAAESAHGDNSPFKRPDVAPSSCPRRWPGHSMPSLLRACRDRIQDKRYRGAGQKWRTHTARQQKETR